MELIFVLCLGIVIGGLVLWLYKARENKGLSIEEVNAGYVVKELYQDLQAKLEQKESEINSLNKELAGQKQIAFNYKDKFEEQKGEIERINERMKVEFKNLANEMMEEKSEKFVKLNEEKINLILSPLKEKIADFEKKVEEKYSLELKDKASLRVELEQMMKLNLQVSDDAKRLTLALKGDKKVQGNWGELQLENIFTYAGLEKDIHYFAQPDYKTEVGHQRPDFVIKMPNERYIIVDSKVSLVDYESYFNTDDDAQRQKHLLNHIGAIKNHIDELSKKKYEKIDALTQLDYVLMFFPIEHSLTTAISEDKTIIETALRKNIMLVSTTTLLATLRTIAYIWKQENQKKNVLEIAKEGGALYDKFVLFTTDLINLGKKIDDAKGSYTDAMKKLTESDMKGTTIVGRIEKLKKLGANATKSQDSRLLDRGEAE